MIWYRESIQNTYRHLETSENGLSSDEVSKRLEQYGLNRLAVKKEPLWRVIIEPFRSVFVAVLGLAVLVSLITDEALDAIIIGLIIVINSAIFYTQQFMTNRVLRSLKRHSISTVKVIRDGQPQDVLSTEIVPGDIVVLNEGERIPADARLVFSDHLQIDESALTGESVPIRKTTNTLEAEHQIYEQRNMVFQGTYVTSGAGRAVVVETGARTEFGKIAQLASVEYAKSPVQAKIDQLIALLVKAVGAIAVVVFLLSLARGIPTGEALRFVLSLSVAAVPEGLPVALTVIIVLGMRRMAKKKALVRSFKAIEDVGLITDIATDKTGTLTKNRLSVVDQWNLNKADSAELAKKTLDAKNISDPLDQAIAGGDKNLPGVSKVYPFDLSLRMSGAYVEKDGKVYIKGSPEHMVALAHLPAGLHAEAESQMHQMAAKGYRVIAVATVDTAKAPKDLSKIKKVDLAGFIALADELRPEAAGAIADAQTAGMKVRMITGDHYETAYNIGKEIGIATHPDQVIQGTDLPQNEQALAATIQEKTVFARILPKDKFRILKALKQNGITAMTGDGVNDVPALANAHVGFAMGSGSDIAKDAGGIVLMNDNFSTIVQAIREGRKIYDNIRRMLFYLLSASLGKVLTMIGALLFGLPLPVTAIQILWINLVTETAMALPLGLEPEEEGLMKRPPRKPKEPLLSRLLLSRIVLVGLTISAVALGLVFYFYERGFSTEYIQTVIFMALIAGEWTHAFNARSEHLSFFSRLRVLNISLLIGLVIAVLLQGLVMAGPLKELFSIEPVPFETLAGASAIMAVSVLAIVELHKFYEATRINGGKGSNLR